MSRNAAPATTTTSLGARFARPTDVSVARDSQDARDQDVVVLLPLDQVRAAPWQSRRFFDDDALDALAASIREHGVLHPVSVRRVVGTGNGGARYELIFGERRLRAVRVNAARHAGGATGIATIPARIIDVDDVGARAMTLVENAVRDDIRPLEIALGFRELRDALLVAGQPAGIRALGRHACQSASVVSEYMTIADTITDDVLRIAGYMLDSGALDHARIGRLTKGALLRAARGATDEARAATLRAVRVQRAGPHARGELGDVDVPDDPAAAAAADDPAMRYWSDGGVSLRVAPPIARLSAAAARRYTDAVAPILRALVRRAAPDDGYLVSSSGPGLVLSVPDVRTLSESQKRRLQHAVTELLRDG